MVTDDQTDTRTNRNLILNDNIISNKEETHGERYCDSMRPWGCGQRVLRVYNTAWASIMNRPARVSRGEDWEWTDY